MLLHVPLSEFMPLCLTNSRALSKAHSSTLHLWNLPPRRLFSLQQLLNCPQVPLLTQPCFQCRRPVLSPGPKSTLSSETSVFRPGCLCLPSPILHLSYTLPDPGCHV